VQLKPDTIHSQPDIFQPGILVRSKLVDGWRDYFVVLLPQPGSDVSRYSSYLEIANGTNRLAFCEDGGTTLSNHANLYNSLTNQFARPLSGGIFFQFQTATNLLDSSKFSISEGGGTWWFYLKDFSDEK